MLRISVSRIRIFFAVLGCAILSASLFDWAQNLRAAESGYTWVKADAPIASAAETAEIWQISASCARPFFVNAVLQSKVRLANHYAVAPEPVRAWRTRPLGEGLQPATDRSGGGLYRPVNGEQDRRGQSSTQSERGAMLHARYAEWYANLFKLEVSEHEWERRLANVADQSVTVSEATRQSFGAYSDRGIERVGGQGDFDHYLLVLLGLGGFSDDQEQALRADCVKLIPVERIFKSANYLADIWRWPVDHAAAFSFGLELVLIGIFFFPIDLWLATGDLDVVRRHIGAEISRFMAKVAAEAVAKVRGFPRSKFALALSRIARTVLASARAILTARTFPGPAVGEIPFVSKLAALRLPRHAPDVPALIACKKIVEDGVDWSKRAMTAIAMPEMR